MTAWLLMWLWQGTALAVSLSLLLRFLPRVNAATRYMLWWSAFAGLILLGWQGLPTSHHLAGAGLTASMNGMSGKSWSAIQVTPLPAWALSFIMTAWVCVACFRLLRIFPGLHALYRLKDACRPFPPELEAQLTLWRERKGRLVRLAVCDGLPGAAVLGFHDPCIAVPSSLLAGLQPDELDQIILHEYGHVQRRDDWMRLLQTLLEAALWPHPASYLIGRTLNLEREVACDDWVIARTGSPRNYARCLSRVAERPRVATPPAFAQALFGGRGHLLSRVDRLLDGRRNTRRTPSLPVAMLGGLAIAVCAAQLRSFPMISDVVPFSTVAATPVASIPVVSSLSRMVASPLVVSGFSRTVVTRPVVSGFSRTIAKEADTTEVADVSSVELQPDPPETVLHPSRVFAGVYERPDESLPARPKKDGYASFDGVVNAGVGIGQAAQKAGVELSDAFTRAGTGLARRF